MWYEHFTASDIYIYIYICICMYAYTVWAIGRWGVGMGFIVYYSLTKRSL